MNTTTKYLLKCFRSPSLSLQLKKIHINNVGSNKSLLPIQTNHNSLWSTLYKRNRNLPVTWNFTQNNLWTDLQKRNIHSQAVNVSRANSFVSVSCVRFFSSKNTPGKQTDDDVNKTTTTVAAENREKDKNEDLSLSFPTDEKKPSLYARFKQMYKQYWYVLLPVHIATSCVWLGGFYYLSQSGVDIPALLESLNFSETIVSKLRDSTMGHVAITYMCYKIITPIRYTVTLGGTTISIKYLSQWGYIRPVPSKEKLRQMYDDQKAKFKQQQ